MERTNPILVSDEVLRGIEAVRASGKTNMLDAPVVKRLARKMGYPEAADWIDDHLALYCVGVFAGFASMDEGGEA